MSLTTLSNCRTSFFVEIINKAKKKSEREFVREDSLSFRLIRLIGFLKSSSIASNANLESIEEDLLDFLNNFSLIVVRECFETIK